MSTAGCRLGLSVWVCVWRVLCEIGFNGQLPARVRHGPWGWRALGLGLARGLELELADIIKTGAARVSNLSAEAARQWISGSVVVVEGARPTEEPRPDAATRGANDNDPPQRGQLACPVLLPVC